MPEKHSNVLVAGAPSIPGLTFRSFHGESDYPFIISVIEGSKGADQVEIAATVQDVARAYKHLVNCNPYEDIVFAEVHNSVIGYARVWWQEEPDDTRSYFVFIPLLPEWRGKGIRRALLRYSENRLREIASHHSVSGSRFFEARAEDTEIHWQELLKSEGYTPARYFFRMIRSLDRDIPEVPLPEGIEVRAVSNDYWKVWRAAQEAFGDTFGASEVSDERFEEWMENPTFSPELWVVAWDKQEVTGMVLSFIDEKENKEYGRNQGVMKLVAVRRPYRGRGLARALLGRGLRILKECGMSEVMLSVDTEGTGTLRLYESMGFKTVKQFVTYRKKLD